MRLTIIVSDSTVYVDAIVYIVPDMLEFIPDGVSALQWNDGKGWIEFKEDDFGEHKPNNQRITEIPSWAVSCQDRWAALYAAEHAERDVQSVTQSITSTGTQAF